MWCYVGFKAPVFYVPSWDPKVCGRLWCLSKLAFLSNSHLVSQQYFDKVLVTQADPQIQ
jgi:hypothetical protein